MDLELEISRALSTIGTWGLSSNKPRPSGPGVQGRELTYDDVRDERIEVAAQHALVRLSKKTPAERKAATGLLIAVKGGSLAGIYQENQRGPALRARAAGGNWWEIIPQGKDAFVQRDSYDLEPPFLVYRQVAGSDPNRLDAALLAGWASWWCQLKCAWRWEACKKGCSAFDPGCFNRCAEELCDCLKLCGAPCGNGSLKRRSP